jgi:hypothetical protein
MKEKFEEMIMKMGFTPYYISNLDDINEALEFNPTTNKLIRIEIQMDGQDERKRICIRSFHMDTYNRKVYVRQLFSGPVLLLPPNGDINYDFYEILLKNYNLIG